MTSPLQRPRVDDTARRAVLSLVGRRGRVAMEEARRELDVASPRFEEMVMMLVDADELTATDEGELRLGPAAAPVQRHVVDGTTYRIGRVTPAESERLVAAVRETDGNAPRVAGEPLVSVLRHEREAGSDDSDAPPDDVAALTTDEAERCSFLATVAGSEEVAGWAHIRSREDAGLCDTAWVAANVRHPHRRGGLGRRLLVRCVGWAAVHDFDRLYTTVDPYDESTVTFLETHGWEMKTLCVEDSEVVAAKLEVEV
jgi:GNAT superfamily N-acetyltransferase